MNFTTTTLTTMSLFVSPPSRLNLSQTQNTFPLFSTNIQLKQNKTAKPKTPTCSFNLSITKPNKNAKLKTPSCSFSSSFNLSSTSNALVSHKLKLLTAEFQSLPEPIDRVKRLLHYAGRMQQSAAAARVEENRVAGCATQVWVEVEMDELGRMRFRADSDSEITKGFCYCLIWLLDGAEAEEALRVRVEELGDLNVGVFGTGKVSSRVNGWFNMFDFMQRRTRDLVCERRRMRRVVGVESFRLGSGGVDVDVDDHDDFGGGCCVEEGRINEVLVSV